MSLVSWELPLSPLSDRAIAISLRPFLSEICKISYRSVPNLNNCEIPALDCYSILLQEEYKGSIYCRGIPTNQPGFSPQRQRIFHQPSSSTSCGSKISPTRSARASRARRSKPPPSLKSRTQCVRWVPRSPYSRPKCLIGCGAKKGRSSRIIQGARAA